MRIRAIVAIVAIFAMVLATPAAAQTTSSGEATSQTVGVELTVGDLVLEYLEETETVEGGALEALSIDMLATRIDDPFAEISVLPLDATILGEQFGGDRITVDSTDDAGETQAISTPLGTVGRLAFNATADEDSARSILMAADQIAAQLDAIATGASLAQLLILSEVDPSESLSTVGFSVTGVDVGGVVAGILAELPLEVLLAIAEDFVDLDAFLSGELDAILADINGHLDALVDPAALEDALGDLEAVLDDLNSVIDLDPADLDADDLALLDGLIVEYGCDIDQTLLDLLVLDPALIDVDDASGLIDAVIACLLDALEDEAETVDGLLTTIDEELGELVAALEELVDTLTGLIEDLISELLGALPEVDVPQLGDLTVGMLAQADAEEATAELVCSLGGEALDCTEPLDAANETVGAVVDAVTGILGELGVVDGTVTLELLGGGTETSTDGDTNEAQAVLQVLALHVPALEIDLEGALDGLTDLLQGLELGDLVDRVRTELEALAGVLDEDALDLLDEVDDLLGTDLWETADGIVAEIDGALAESGLLDVLTDLIDDLLGLVDLEIPLAVTTPSVDLTIDPTVTASFTPAEDVDLGAPEPDDEPALPTTGGGLALLALLALTGAAALLRRRPDGAI